MSGQVSHVFTHDDRVDQSQLHMCMHATHTCMTVSCMWLHACEVEARPDDAAAASALLADTMKACHGPDAPAELKAEAAEVCNALVLRLVPSLSASTGGTREAAKAGLHTLARFNIYIYICVKCAPLCIEYILHV